MIPISQVTIPSSNTIQVQTAQPKMNKKKATPAVIAQAPVQNVENNVTTVIKCTKCNGAGVIMVNQPATTAVSTNVAQTSPVKTQIIQVTPQTTQVTQSHQIYPVSQSQQAPQQTQQVTVQSQIQQVQIQPQQQSTQQSAQQHTTTTSQMPPPP